MIKNLLFTLAFTFLGTLAYAQFDEITIIGTTAVGTQDIAAVSEENAYNDDNTNYWTGNPDTEDEVAITFDLGCVHELSEIGINFWKSDERTTTFSIAIADDAAGPFTIVLDSQVSDMDTSTVDTEQMFSLLGNMARYVRFIGIGNSSSTNWTSIANVNIYGDVECINGTTNITNSQLVEQGVTMFPVPVTNNVLNIESTAKTLNSILIYNLAGQQVLRTNGQDNRSTKIDVSNLSSGTYFIKIEGIGQGQFLIK